MVRMIVVLAAWLVAVSAQAQPFFEGKTITVLTSTGSGGSYDITARLISRHMPRFIPGHPNMICLLYTSDAADE